MCKNEMLRNVVSYVHIHRQISMWSGFMWIHGKLSMSEYSW